MVTYVKRAEQLARRYLKQGIALTPYRLVRADGVHDGAPYDAVAHNSVDHMNALFSDPEWLEKYESPDRRRLHRETKALLLDAKAPAEVHSLGDFGCGPGTFFKYLQPEYGHADTFGYDFANATLTAARIVAPEVVFEQYDLYTPPPRKHDAVVCSQTIEHLLYPDRALTSLIDAIAPSGVLVITVPDGRRDTYRGHINFWSLESWNVFIGSQASGRRFETHWLGRSRGTAAHLAAVIWG